MQRPPHISVLFFLAAGAVIIAMFWSANRSARPASPEIEKGAPLLTETRDDRIRRLSKDWGAEPDFSPTFNALDPSFDLTEENVSAFDPNDDYFGLPRTEGYDLVYGLCGACHSLRIVMQQHATRDRWAELLLWMTEKQGMPALSPDDTMLVTDYLAENFGSPN